MCEDHFNEYDTVIHSWQVIEEVLASGLTDGILCDIGMPVMHKNVLYNCRVLLLDSKVLGLRPKMNLADGGNYFESRWFSAWKYNHVEEFDLPVGIQKLTGATSVPIGHIVVKCLDVEIGFEICEEAWISNNPMIQQSLDGVEIFVNSSASHAEEGKLKRKIQMVC
jgi:NAD+ synthase (glutamine-hydrolysing)